MSGVVLSAAALLSRVGRPRRSSTLSTAPRLPNAEKPTLRTASGAGTAGKLCRSHGSRKGAGAHSPRGELRAANLQEAATSGTGFLLSFSLLTITQRPNFG